MFTTIITEPPTVALRPSHHEVKAGTTMFLNLAAEGTPPPVFQWYRNGYLVPGLTGKKALQYIPVVYALEDNFLCFIYSFTVFLH